MHVSIPYVYELKGRRGQVNRIIHRSGRLSREVPEYSAEEAPVVAEWTYHTGYVDRHVACRSMRGEHFLCFPVPMNLSMSTTHGWRDGSQIGQVISTKIGLEPKSHARKIFQHVWNGTTPDVGNYNGNIDEVEYSQEDVRLAKARAFLNSMVFIGGEAWTRCQEPKLRAWCRPGGYEATIEIDTDHDSNLVEPGVGPHKKATWLSTDAFFNFAQENEARAHLVSNGGVDNPNVRYVGIKSPKSITVHDPNAFSFEGTAPRLRGIAVDLTGLLENVIGEKNIDVVADWMALRDGSNFDAPLDQEGVEALIAKLIPEVEDGTARNGIERRLAEARSIRAIIDGRAPGNQAQARRPRLR